MDYKKVFWGEGFHPHILPCVRPLYFKVNVYKTKHNGNDGKEHNKKQKMLKKVGFSLFKKG